MTHFHIGIRIDDIVNISPSGDEKFPTKYLLRRGGSVTSTGDWRENIAHIEAILRENAREQMQDNAVKTHDLRTVMDAEARVTFLKNEIAALESLRRTEFAKDNTGLLGAVSVWKEFRASGKQYITKDQIAIIDAFLGREADRG